MEPASPVPSRVAAKPRRHRRLASRGVGLIRRGVRASVRAPLAWWARRRPTQQLALGLGLYVALGFAVLCLPWSRVGPAHPIDHLFSAVSAISTTGLTTVSVGDTYSTLGQATLLVLFQIGGVGFMTISSVLILARGKSLSEGRLGVLRAGFSLPHYFVVQHFLVQVVVFTLACEAAGTLLLWWRFDAAGVPGALWSAIFHSVSAFATAGFSLSNTSLEPFAHDWIVNLTIGGLCYAGAIGFIVVQDVWYSVKLRERMLTFTSAVILWMTAAVFVLGTLALLVLEPSLGHLPLGERVLAAAFQTMTASSTAGFNTVPIGTLSPAALCVLMLAMLIGASPSGTGGGIKTTTVSAILGNLMSVLRGRSAIRWLGHEIPLARVLWAFASTSLYLIGLALGVLLLAATERAPFLSIVFEAASAIGTVGLSLGLTSDLSLAGKVVVIALMFVGRCGPLTIGLALLRPLPQAGSTRSDDLAV